MVRRGEERGGEGKECVFNEKSDIYYMPSEEGRSLLLEHSSKNKQTMRIKETSDNFKKSEEGKFKTSRCLSSNM